MKTVAFVPIKFKSSRIKNKNILKFGSNPLCFYIFQSLKRAGIKDIFVYCSDSKIRNYIPNYVNFLKRDKILDRDETKGMQIYKEFCSQVKSDIYVLAHATSPFLSHKSIKLGLESISKGHDSALTVQRIQTFAWYNNSTLNYSLKDIPRTQNIEPIFIETSGFYMFKNEVIKQNRRIGQNPFFVELDHIESIDIDEKKDLEFAREVLKFTPI